jgi:hypothetical protein
MVLNPVKNYADVSVSSLADTDSVMNLIDMP